MSSHGKKLGMVIPVAMVLYGMYASTESVPLLVDTMKTMKAMPAAVGGGGPIDLKSILDPFDRDRRSLLEGAMPDVAQVAAGATGLEVIKVVHLAGPFRMIGWKGELLRPGMSAGDLKLIKIAPGAVHVSYLGKLYVLEGCVEQPLVGGVLLAGPARAAVVGGTVLKIGDEKAGIRVMDVNIDEVGLSIDGVSVVCPINPRPVLVAMREERS